MIESLTVLTFNVRSIKNAFDQVKISRYLKSLRPAPAAIPLQEHHFSFNSLREGALRVLGQGITDLYRREFYASGAFHHQTPPVDVLGNSEIERRGLRQRLVIVAWYHHAESADGHGLLRHAQ
ncbi:BZ3500_MvSof-1268-A1-R1_Chr2-1g04406 [Microbotryum saponariae]|uniref:BZ3500_MvSof-1268-A1-R1_Chr2-1g04406 protein n=1 Tax=Microbotryum saponariae TaxID=289078 RepID=A0A2X0MBU7_9BASI|nr:BZ3500_MvSof-1268-A1-R1_Chr2-1g04406 [Microbotryum saponariae]SCZ91620.1 BZ3501_MvSof-1269-A2-R1_Chr2-1g04062 [Microbotryum saponariae]